MNRVLKQIKYQRISFIIICCLALTMAVNAQEMIFKNGFEQPVIFGLAGSHALAPIYQEPTELATLYYPTDASAANKVPVVFLAPGFGNDNTDPLKSYDTILKFIASHGFAAVFIQDNNALDFSSTDMIADAVAMVAAKSDILDTTRIGVIGHSSGGGYTFNILDKLSDDEGWGANGRFIFITEGWFAFDMMQIDMRTLPSNTNVVMQQYGPGGNSFNNNVDARILLTEYYLLESISNDKKDYQIDVDGDHHYPYGQGGTQADYDGISIILEPLDALMQYTFVNSNDMNAHDAALELGDDDPYNDGAGIQTVLPRDDAYINYPCNGVNFTDEDIDYCDIKGYPYSSKFTAILTNNATVQPSLGGVPSIDAEYGTTITRLTERALQLDNYNGNPPFAGSPRGNHQPYPKTGAWNADMTMIRMNYRYYDADTLQEIPLSTTSGNYPLTTNTWDVNDLYIINGALNERKWSTVDPKVFYGVYLSGTNGQFWKGTIDRAAQTISYANGLIHDFGAGFEKFTLGKYEGNISYDDTKVVFAGRKTGQTYLTAIVYDKATDTVIAQKDFDGNNGNAFIEWTDPDPNAVPPIEQVFDWISVSPLGNHIIISSDNKMELYDMDLNYLGQLAASSGHGDFGLAQNGEEVFVQYEYGANAGVWAYRLQKFVDGEPVNVYRHQLLPDKYNGGHISCRNYQRPGWCYLSTKADNYRDVFALRINFGHHSLHVVNRFAQTHTLTQTNSLGNVSPDGKRVLFFTDWGDAGLDYYDRDTYQAQRVD